MARNAKIVQAMAGKASDAAHDDHFVMAFCGAAFAANSPSHTNSGENAKKLERWNAREDKDEKKP